MLLTTKTFTSHSLRFQRIVDIRSAEKEVGPVLKISIRLSLDFRDLG